jgi:hypothetical protein
MGEIEHKNKLKQEIVFFIKKLPLPKLEDALDYIKWIWLNPGKGKAENIKQAVSISREIQSRHKADKGWDSVKEIRKWRESH